MDDRVFNLSEKNSIANQFLAELRDEQVQKDRMRFRRNLERLGEIFAYEISKVLEYKEIEVETPLGIAKASVPADEVVLATILRAGLPMHQGMLNFFDGAGNAFVSAFRKHYKGGDFEVKLEYISCPNLTDKILIISDAMLATGASMSLAIKELLEFGEPKAIHFVTGIASASGLAHMRRIFPKAYIWMGALDEELTAKSYIVPGLGDAGDLGYGAKLQE